MNKQSKYLKYIFLVLLVSALIILNTKIINGLTFILQKPEDFKVWLDGFGIYSRIVYVLLTIVQIILAFIPGEPFEIAAGYAFGMYEGTILCLLAGAIGSIIVISLVRKFGKKFIDFFFDDKEINKLNFLKEDDKRIILILLIFLIPGTPKDLMCYFVGLTDINLIYLYIIASFGRIPSIVSSTIGGHFLGTSNYFIAITSFIIALLLALIGIYIYKQILKKKNQ